MLTGEFAIRIGYKDTDAMGIAHHSNYAVYYEIARTEILRSLGTTYLDLEKDGIMLPVIELKQRFYIPARYDDIITVKTTLKEFPEAKMLFEHRLMNQHGELVNEGTILLAYMNSATRRACRAPRWFVDFFRPYFGDGK